MRRSAGRIAQVALLIVLTGGASASAQIGGNESIQGTVLDTSKAALPGVTVTATNVATGIQTVRQATDAGVYTLSGFEFFRHKSLDAKAFFATPRRSHFADLALLPVVPA